MTRCVHDMVPEWCAFCLRLPDLPDDNDHRLATARPDPTECARCGGKIQEDDEFGRDPMGDYVCWRCVW
ncbi:hypothetical protein [Kutzneria chonburiensis]|uniref:Small CPxCG-related zinc finger protein n=1 Tax=Kutzneria chonburiensis TaxID=1483604 RepID=A0ABV6N365_9PSEU|nr:hypothetical protein [Kutzneria chonburiensis]